MFGSSIIFNGQFKNSRRTVEHLTHYAVPIGPDYPDDQGGWDWKRTRKPRKPMNGRILEEDPSWFRPERPFEPRRQKSPGTRERFCGISEHVDECPSCPDGSSGDWTSYAPIHLEGFTQRLFPVIEHNDKQRPPPFVKRSSTIQCHGPHCPPERKLGPLPPRRVPPPPPPPKPPTTAVGPTVPPRERKPTTRPIITPPPPPPVEPTTAGWVNPPFPEGPWPPHEYDYWQSVTDAIQEYELTRAQIEKLKSRSHIDPGVQQLREFQIDDLEKKLNTIVADAKEDLGYDPSRK